MSTTSAIKSLRMIYMVTPFHLGYIKLKYYLTNYSHKVGVDNYLLCTGRMIFMVTFRSVNHPAGTLLIV